MSTEQVRFAIGEFGKLYKFTGNEVPAGAQLLIEKDGKTLTKAGVQFCKMRGIASPNAEYIRVICDQYTSQVLLDAKEAHDKSLDLQPQRMEQTKIMSERLRRDWEAQDKAYQETVAAQKKASTVKT